MSFIYIDYTNGNDVTGDGTTGSPYKTFSKGFSQSVAGDIIDLSGYFNWSLDPSFVSTGIPINKNITVQGHEGALAEIDCAGSGKVFDITTSSVDLSMLNLKIINARSNRNLIVDMYTNSYVYGHQIWFSDCSSTGGSGGTAGGTFHIGSGQNLVFNKCTFSNVTDYACIYTNTGSTSVVTNCTFYNNTNSRVIYFLNGEMTLTNNTFFANSSTILRLHGSGTVYIKNNILAGGFNPIDRTSSAVVQANNVISNDTNTGSQFNDGDNNTYNAILPDSSFGSFGINGAINGIPTVPILASNPAVGAGSTTSHNSITPPLYDARGLSRDLDNYDVGAYAYTAYSPPSLTLDGASSSYNLYVDQSITPITFTVTSASAESWQVTPALPDGLSQSSSTGTITGTPSTINMYSQSYTVSAGNSYGSDTVNITLRVGDSYLYSLDTLPGYTETVISDINQLQVSGTDLLDISSYMIDNSGTRRRHLIDTIHSRSQNASYNYFRATRADLQLPSTYTRDTIRVYRKGTTIDLNDLSGDEGAYSSIGLSGESCTFLNVGGNGNDVVFVANGDTTYNITYNDVDIGTGTDGEEIVIAGVAFYLGSVGTEGTAGDTICFTGDAEVLTPDGNVPIKDITRGQTIITDSGPTNVMYAVRVVNESPVLVTINKDSLGLNYPTCTTTITPEHSIMLSDGTWKKAQDLISVNGISYTPATPYQFVYHITTEHNSTMIVNGLRVETLDTRNINVYTRTNNINITNRTIEQC